MSQALYRKWRPARFEQVVGQEHVTRTLQNSVAAGRLGHAYLFSGPRGTGKTTSARLLAKAANCLHEELAQRPCDACGPCLAVNEGRFMDLIEIDAASNTGVDDIRSLRDKINFSPSEGRFKVYIIDEVHMLSTAAFNALLKTLEEPPPHAKFVLATTEEHKVPLTIKSRCQQFSFRLLTTQEIVGRLRWLAEQEDLTIEPEALRMIARHGAGSLRDAESLLDQLVTAPGDTITLARAQMVLGTASDESVQTLSDAILRGDGAAGLDIIHQSLSSGTDARQLARQMVSYLRQLLLLQTSGQKMALDVSAEQEELMLEQSRQAERGDLIQAVKRFNEAATTVSGSWQPQLPLELAFLELLPATAGSLSVPPRQTAPARAKTSQPAAPTAEPSVKERAVRATPPAAAVEEAASPPQAQPAAETAPSPVQSKPKPEPAVAAAAPAETAGAIALGDVTARWAALRERVGQVDRNLPPLLAACKPLATEDDVLVLGFDYPILKDKFDNKQGAREIVSEALSELLGTSCLVRTVVTSHYTPPAQAPVAKAVEVNRDDFDALAKELGGVVKDS